jgi:spore maturation protein CgeB
MFYHSLVSDWNNGNAHFVRGIANELIKRHHDVRIYEPRHAWSVENLVKDCGKGAIHAYRRAYPHLTSRRYNPATIDLDEVLDGADVVLVHEWNDHALVRRIGEHHAQTREYKLFFHDTHHRSVTDSASMAWYDLRDYDGVLAFGATVRDVYLDRGWAERAWVWHEAADTSLFRPMKEIEPTDDLVWIGNWGDGERAAELEEFLIDPVQELGLRANVYGVRYPGDAQATLSAAGIRYLGRIANYDAPRVYAHHRVTVHVPRRPYVAALPGIPTIRVFEALACGVPLVSAPWSDCEHLFTPGTDFLVARNGTEMCAQLRAVLEDRELATALSVKGRSTILARHTCGHRVDELLSIVGALKGKPVRFAGAA